MRIVEIILDGFKSYAKRTIISGFDSEFNAITGLNGSGKSNILDSICFVLGISNLSQACWARHVPTCAYPCLSVSNAPHSCWRLTLRAERVRCAPQT